LGALFYAEVTRTYDIDVFASVPLQSGPILDLSGLYAWARQRGFEPDAQHLLIHTVPVQFPPGNEGLEHEAVVHALVFDCEGEPVRVMRPEHLIALYLRAGGAGRRERCALLWRAGAVNEQELTAILERYELVERWQEVLSADV
jgi:hypothetical protein